MAQLSVSQIPKCVLSTQMMSPGVGQVTWLAGQVPEPEEAVLEGAGAAEEVLVDEGAEAYEVGDGATLEVVAGA